MRRIAPRVTIRSDRVGEVLKAVEDLTQNRVLVGVPAERGVRAGSGPTNAALAYIHEHGSANRVIPPRPFLGPGIEDARDKIGDLLERGATAAIAGNRESAIKALHAVGLVAQSAVRARLTNGPHLPLAPATLAARRARGNKSDKPLIDTGALRLALTYVLRGKWF